MLCRVKTYADFRFFEARRSAAGGARSVCVKNPPKPLLPNPPGSRELVSRIAFLNPTFLDKKDFVHGRRPLTHDILKRLQVKSRACSAQAAASPCPNGQM